MNYLDGFKCSICGETIDVKISKNGEDFMYIDFYLQPQHPGQYTGDRRIRLCRSCIEKLEFVAASKREQL
jgi:hypothetical protein